VKEEEMPGTVQSLTLIFSVRLRVQMSVSLAEVTLLSPPVSVSFFSVFLSLLPF